MSERELPFNNIARADTGVDNVTLGFWLFIASEVMLFGALFSSYGLLRASATDWPAAGTVLHIGLGAPNTVLLFIVTGLVLRAGRIEPSRFRPLLLAGSGLAIVFLAIKGLEYQAEWRQGLTPATSTFMALYYTLTGVHALHVLGGVFANIWVIAAAKSVGPVMTAGRLKLIGRYWVFVDLVWVVIFVGLYLK